MRGGQIRIEQIHPGSGMVRIPETTGIQAPLARRIFDPRATPKHEQEMSRVRVHIQREPAFSGTVSLPVLRTRSERRWERRTKHPGGRACRVSLWRGHKTGEEHFPGSLDEAGTRRNLSNGTRFCLRGRRNPLPLGRGGGQPYWRRNGGRGICGWSGTGIHGAPFFMSKQLKCSGKGGTRDKNRKYHGKGSGRRDFDFF